MARPLRAHIPDALYHVMSRGNARQQIFIDTSDYKCRMMQQLNSSYSQRFNHRHRQVGHVLQGRFKAPIIDGDDYLRRVVRYIVLNPVRAGLATHPGDWLWSSYRATAGLETPAPFLALDAVWSAFDQDAALAPSVFAAFVAAGTAPGDCLTDPIVSGSPALRARIAAALEPHRDARDIVCAERLACRPTLAQVIGNMADPAALDREMWMAFERYGYSAGEIGKFVGRPAATVWKRIRRVAERCAAEWTAPAKIEI